MPGSAARDASAGSDHGSGVALNPSGLSFDLPSPSPQGRIEDDAQRCESRTGYGARTVHVPIAHVHNSGISPQDLLAYCTRVPYVPHGLSKPSLDTPDFEDYVVSSWERMMEYVYFKHPQARASRFRNGIISRVRVSKLTLWVMFINARVFESLSEGDTSQNNTYHLWINQTDQVIRTTSRRNLSTSEAQGHLGDWLQLLFVKTSLVPSSSIHQVLRHAASVFLEMVYSNPELWQEDHAPISVPLASTIASHPYVLPHFILLDAMTAMAFGVPQQVEYSSMVGSVSTNFSGYVDCSPLDFLALLVEINACRDKTPNARSWTEIESKLSNWRPHTSEHEANWESWMAVTWLAMQESWRHALLVYLYMSVCNISSDDPRVQSSVKQILQISRTFRKQDSTGTMALFFIQYLMAGICARTEGHRSIVRKRLANISDTRHWLLRAADFVPILDDLWHNAAANGRPVRWLDYLCSRERVLPVRM